MKKKAKRLVMIALSVLLILSLSGCIVPYTVASFTGFYVFESLDEINEIAQKLRESKETGSVSVIPSADEGITEDVTEEEDSKTESSASPETEDADANKKEEAAGNDKEDTKENIDKEDSVTESSSASEKEDENVSGQKSSIPEYVHYEKDDFAKVCSALKEAGEKDDPDGISSNYEESVKELKLITTMSTVAFVNFSKNVNDTYYDEEYTYCEELYTDCYDLFMITCQSVLESKGEETFEKIANESILEEAREYEPLTDHAKELLKKETQLENEYNKRVDALDSLTYEKNGKEYSFGQLYENDSELSMLSLFHYEDFIEVYTGLLKAANEELGPLYLELIDLRRDLADEFGYDTYSDYSYKEVYGRGYTTEDVKKYCDVIKKNVGERFYQDTYFKLYNTSHFETEFTTDEMLDCLKKITDPFSPLLQEAYKVMLDENLYDIGDGPGRYTGSYTTSVYSISAPYIFVNAGSDLSGLSTLQHEFGHFTNDLYEEKDPDYFFCSGNYDVLEIHSNALQLLCSNHYSDIAPQREAEEAQDYELAAQLDSILEGCIYDEFQRAVYEKTDWTLDKLNTLYGSIISEYGQQALPGNEYMWVLINHNFESPLYYISYAVSALSALEIWTLSLDREQKAVDAWEMIVKEKDDEDYETVIEKAGLTPFKDSEGVVKICNYVMNYINGITAEEDIAA